MPAAGERARGMREANATLVTGWHEAQESQKKSQNKRQKPMAYKVGYKVLLSTKNLRMPGAKRSGAHASWVLSGFATQSVRRLIDWPCRPYTSSTTSFMFPC